MKVILSVVAVLLCTVAYANASCAMDYTKPPPPAVSREIMGTCMPIVDNMNAVTPGQQRSCAKSCRNFQLAEQWPLCPTPGVLGFQPMQTCRDSCLAFKKDCGSNIDCNQYPTDNCNRGPLHAEPKQTVQLQNPTQDQTEGISVFKAPWTNPIIGKTQQGTLCVAGKCVPADYQSIFMCANAAIDPFNGVNCNQYDYTTDVCITGNYVDLHAQNRSHCQEIRWNGMAADKMFGFQCNSEQGAVIPCRSFSDSGDKCRLVQVFASFSYSTSIPWGQSGTCAGPTNGKRCCNLLYAGWKAVNGADDTAFDLF